MNSLPDNDPAKTLFDTLINVINQQAILMAQMAEKINQIESIGGGGSGNGFTVYESGKVYKRYQAVIDPETDTAYLVAPLNGGTEYTSITVETDCENGNLKLLGYEGYIVPFNHTPTPNEVDALPENVVVVEYNPSDTPYTGILTQDNDD